MKKRTLTRNEKITLWLSATALFVSILSIFLSSPVIINYVSRPKLFLAGPKVDEQKNEYNHTFLLVNRGKKVATGIEVELICLSKSTLNILWETKDTTVSRQIVTNGLSGNTETLDKIYVTIERLAPQGKIGFMIQTEKSLLKQAPIFINKRFWEPIIQDVWYDQGRPENF